ncbi:hypothetical protein PRIPAC_87394 [Pristionchus pacificus]|uniref:Uncharacterized protein n=1 Tax=Pristionchus pacificus TaxID=54126 RepID=A0A2A6CX03_PRIPA|nr:hypothetical protein PRIPAC_87394 [Pristionchus pacificus]|eukprot:PDM82764.1 hypothetical protein PRIPAC_37157 [Pristionchus pacificus]
MKIELRISRSATAALRDRNASKNFFCVPYIRFFLKVDVLCAHPDNGTSYFATFCEDRKIKKRCNGAKAGAKGFKWATFTHQFEMNPIGDAKLKVRQLVIFSLKVLLFIDNPAFQDQYNLNCTFSMKDEQWDTLDGLTCAGTVCVDVQEDTMNCPFLISKILSEVFARPVDAA